MKQPKTFKILGWVRDRKGKVVKRPIKDICNSITQFAGHNPSSVEGVHGEMWNTTPYVLEAYEKEL